MLQSLAPVADQKSKVLILGSMPGRVSLAAAQYYAHPQNRFWRILFDFFAEQYSTDYAARLDLCRRRGVALWDSVACCNRTGSLDSTITDVTGNDVDGLLRKFPNIEAVLCNGRASEKYCRKFNAVVPVYMPSTSPLNASVIDVETRWKEVLSGIFADCV